MKKLTISMRGWCIVTVVLMTSTWNSILFIAMLTKESQLQYKQIAANASHLKTIPDLAHDWYPVLPSETQRSLSVSLL